MRVIFAGTPEFAAQALAALRAAGHDIPMVLTQPDRPAGRGLVLQASPVKRLAVEMGLRVFQPTTLKDERAVDEIRQVAADVMVVAAYGLLLPPTVLSLPKQGCINIHASLLPRWRGAAPIQRALLAGDAYSGVCIMQMDAGLDTGAVLLQDRVAIESTTTAGQLHDHLARLGADLIVDCLSRLPLPAVPQAEEGVSYAAKMAKAEAVIDWSASAIQVDRQIRAFNPWPGAQTMFEAGVIKIWQASPVAGEGAPGQILSADRQGIRVACGSGAINITELQKSGGKRLSALQFLSGTSLEGGQRFVGAV